MKWDKRQLRMFRVIGHGIARRITPIKEQRTDLRMLQVSIVLELGYHLCLLDQRRMAQRRRVKR